MEDMSMVKTLRIWQDGVTFMEKGNFEDALMNFLALEGRTDSSQQLITSGRNLFNIGQTYLALERMDMAAKTFEESIEKDKMSAVAHFLLGNINLALNRNERALKNFTDANFFLRGNKLINYYPLGLKAKLYLCEILVNRAIAHSRLGDAQEARNDFLMALQSKVEPRHRIIEDLLLSWQSGQDVEPLKLPSHLVFQPQKRQIDAINAKRNFLGKSKVVVEDEFTRFPTSRSGSTKTLPPSPTPSRAVEDEQLPEQHLPQAKQAVSERHALLNDIRRKESRETLYKVSTETKPPEPVPVILERFVSPSRFPPSPRSSPTPGSGDESFSPATRRKLGGGVRLMTPPSAGNTRPRSPIDMGPPKKPLPPSPRPKSPLMWQQSPQSSDGRDVTLVLTRSVKVDESASTQDLLRAAANTFKLSEDSFALWCMKNNQLTALQDQDLEKLLSSPADSSPKFFCYLNKPE